MELMGYLGKELGQVLTPEVLTNILIGVGIVGGIIFLVVISRR